MSENTILKVITTVDSKLSQIPASNGQLIFVRDTSCVALDWNNTRVFYEDIRILESDAQRRAILAPSKKFYYVKDTCILWRYDEEWVQITSQPAQQVFEAETIYEFPTVGSQHCVYIVTSENATYRWDDISLKYYCIGRDYKEIKVINGGSSL